MANGSNYWIEKTGELQNLGWYVFEKTKTRSLKTTPFYEDLFISYRKAEATIRPEFSSKLEVMNIPLFNNTVITGDPDKDLLSHVLLANDMSKFHHVVRNNRLITFKELARKCKINHYECWSYS